ncbi:peptidase family M3-domain-containing protein [Amylostereum chailletii]|nr:peptidase family M3-domain-containing protein [Amylostereum chailletii]
MLARNAKASITNTVRRIPRYRPRSERLRRLATVAPGSATDSDLVHFFDHPPDKQYASLAPSGLFGQPTLASPSSFQTLAHATLLRAHLLTERIVRARGNREELLKVVKNLDRLSDMLCSIIDLAELVRNAHPDRKWVESADEAYDQLCEYMNVLNTHVGLYESLSDVLSDPSIVKSLSREAHQTALIFWRDFEKSGINLPPEQRERFVTLSSEILSLGRQFLHDASSARPPASIQPTELQGLKDLGMGSRLQWQSKFTKRDLLVYPGSLQAQMIMRSAPAEEPRRKVYMAANSSTLQQIHVLESLLRARGQLAQLHFLTSPTVLSLFGTHAGPSTGSNQCGNHHEDPCRNIDTYGQILLAALDQIYHSSAALQSGFDSTAALKQLNDQRGLIPYIEGTSWQTQFGHLFGYGATYYSYLFDRAIASRVWRQLFVASPLNRETGEQFKREVLSHGGGEDPWAMLGTLLGEPRLASGDEEAMREVGRWRIEEDLAVPGRH